MVNPLAKLWVAVKAAAARIPWPQPYGQYGWASTYARPYAARATTAAQESSLVAACVLWIGRTFPEAPVRVRVLDAKGTPAERPDHPLARLLARPNPYYSGSLLWAATLADWTLTGNAYWYKARSGARRVVEYWWLPASTVEPRWPKDGSAFISDYAYWPDGRAEPIPLPVGDVVHYRYGLDSRNPRKGLSPLGSLLRELMTDTEAGAYVNAMLANLGVPGVVISPAGDGQINEQEALALKQAYVAKFGGERRGEPLVLSSGASVVPFGFSPEQMTVRELRRVPEERVSAVLGIPAIVVGLGAGLDRSTFQNFREAREAAVEANLVPTWRLFGEELTTQVLPDWDASGRTLVDFDLSKVRVLQDDQDALHARARQDLGAGLATLNEARAMVGLDATEPNGDVLYLPNTLTPRAIADPIPPPLTRLAAAGADPLAGERKAVERVGPFEYSPDPLPQVVYDQAERRKLSRAWDAAFEGTPYAGMLDAEAVNGNGTH